MCQRDTSPAAGPALGGRLFKGKKYSQKKDLSQSICNIIVLFSVNYAVQVDKISQVKAVTKIKVTNKGQK